MRPIISSLVFVALLGGCDTTSSPAPSTPADTSAPAASVVVEEVKAPVAPDAAVSASAGPAVVPSASAAVDAGASKK